MKSIEDTLKLVTDIVCDLRKTTDIDIALVGGYAVISHGVGRTTMDVDFLLYSGYIQESSSKFFDLFSRAVPAGFELKWVEGSRMLGDPFPYDVIFLTDKSGEYPKMDFIIPRYRWELEGLKKAKPLKGLPFPVISMPYLIAMKLRAGGPRDHADILDLYRLLNDREKEEAQQLAILIKRDKTLRKLLEPEKMDQDEPGNEDLLI
jgi:hypothetical protein